MIPVVVYKVRAGRAAQAVEEATQIVSRWSESSGNEQVAAELMKGGWPLVDLVERIALALLGAQGCDVDALEEIIEWSDSDGRDALAEWERAQPAHLEVVRG